MCDVQLLQVASYSPVASPETIEILDESDENELEEQVDMALTDTEETECAIESSVQSPSECDTEIPVNLECSDLEDQAQMLSTAACFQSSLTTVDQTVNDLGTLLLPSKTSAEISATMSKLSNSQRYSLLYNHISPPSVLPSSYSYGCN